MNVTANDTTTTTTTVGDGLPIQVMTLSQEIIVLCLTWISALCSITGSSCILYLLYRKTNGQGTLLDTLGRLLLGMSTCDILHSFGLLWQGLLLPADTSPRHLAMGNDATCTALGASIQFGFSVAFYNGMVSFYYLCTIRHGMTSRQIAQRYEPYMHGLAIGFPLITAALGAGLGAFHESYAGPLCWISDWPEGCDGDPDLPCKSFLLGYVFAGGPVLLMLICIIVNMVRIYRHTHATLSRGARRSFDGSTQDSQIMQRIDQVATQAYCYVLVFCLTFCFAFVTQSMEATAGDFNWNEQDVLPLIVLNQIFFPLQGFWNFVIYIRPRYIAVRCFHLHQSRWWALREALRREAMTTSAGASLSGQSSHLRRGQRRRPRPPGQRPQLRHMGSRSDDSIPTVASYPQQQQQSPHCINPQRISPAPSQNSEGHGHAMPSFSCGSNTPSPVVQQQHHRSKSSSNSSGDKASCVSFASASQDSSKVSTSSVVLSTAELSLENDKVEEEESEEEEENKLEQNSDKDSKGRL